MHGSARSEQSAPAVRFVAGCAPMHRPHANTFKRSLIFVAVAILPLLVRYLFDVILIAFGAIIVAMLLWLGVEPFLRWLALRQGIALALSGLLIVTIVGRSSFCSERGSLFSYRTCSNAPPQAQRWVAQTLRQSEWGALALNHIAGSNFSLTDLLGSSLRISSSVLEVVVIAVISGIYLAAQPRLYLDLSSSCFRPRRTLARLSGSKP